MLNYKIHKYNTFKKLLSLILGVILLCVCLLSGCTSENYNLYFGISEMPRNIDPQKAQSQAELLAVRNCFRGLYKQDKNGNAAPDLAKSVDTSEDGLTYTFTLIDAKWSDGTTVTADDFVFALTRAADPVTASPSQQKLLNIVGVPEMLDGDKNAVIGVKAIDQKTLEIRLIKPDETFLSLLTSAVFMPCNREFFENCKGKYGLDRKNILTNGHYYPSQWTENRHLKLSLSEEMSQNSKLAQHVFLSVSTTGKNTIQRIKAKEISMAVDSLDDFSGINENEYTVDVKYQKNYAIVFNKNTEVGGNRQLTDSFASSIHRELYKLKMSEHIKSADTVIPADTTFSNKHHNYKDLKKYSFEYEPTKARENFLNAVSQLKNKKLPQISVLTVENTETKKVLNEIVSQWQSTLGAYVNITTVSSEQTLLENVTNGSFTVALVPLSGDIAEILSKFSNENSGLYIDNPEYDKTVKALNSATSLKDAEAYIRKCVEILSEESAVIPIISVPTAFIYSGNLNNVAFSDVDGTVDFSIIYKNK